MPSESEDVKHFLADAMGISLPCRSPDQVRGGEGGPSPRVAPSARPRINSAEGRVGCLVTMPPPVRLARGSRPPSPADPNRACPISADILPKSGKPDLGGVEGEAPSVTHSSVK